MVGERLNLQCEINSSAIPLNHKNICCYLVEKNIDNLLIYFTHQKNLQRILEMNQCVSLFGKKVEKYPGKQNDSR